MLQPSICAAFGQLLKIEKGSKDDVVSKAAMEEELAASVAALQVSRADSLISAVALTDRVCNGAEPLLLQAYDGHKLKAKEFVKMKRSHSARPGLRPSSKLRRRGATAGSRRPRSRAKVPIGHREVEVCMMPLMLCTLPSPTSFFFFTPDVDRYSRTIQASC